MINTITLEGNATKNVESRVSKSGKESACIRLAQSQGEKTLYIDVYCYDKTAEFAKNYVSKGSKVFVAGRLVDDSFDNKEGRRVNHIALIANAISSPKLKNENEENKIEVDDLPF